MPDKYMPRITAKTTDEFKKIEDKINLLTDEIKSQIEVAEYGTVGLHCTFKKYIADKVILPTDIRQISHFGDYIGCYAEEYFFKLPIYEGKEWYDFIFRIYPKP